MNTANWMNGLINEVYTLYNNEGIIMATSVLNIWDTPSPYTGNDDVQRLASFQSLNGVLDGDLAHYVTLRAQDGGRAGSFNGLCNADYDASMCYSGLGTTYQFVPVYSYNVMVCTHEMGHLLGSRHTHACVWNGDNTRIDNCGGNSGFPEGNCNSNPPDPAQGGTIMSYCHLPGRPGVNFNLGFGPQPGNVIRNSVNGASCLICACAGSPAEITQNTVISNDLVLGGDLAVRTGAQLTVSGATLYVSEGHRILVERNARLIIRNGGKVTRGCGAPNWKGIEVLGNNAKAQPDIPNPFMLPPLTDPDQAGQVVVFGGGTVEWAEIGIAAGRGHAPEFWGGLVYSNGGKFRNNFRDLDFMPYGFSPNKSRFIDTDFWSNIDDIAITQGVWIWGTDGIEFSGCSFTAYDFEAIRAFDASILVWNRNIFWQNERGISLEATYPMSAKSIVGSAGLPENIFWGNKYHIIGQAAGGFSPSSFSLDVINNDFVGGEYGVAVGGPSNYRIGGNRFSGMDIGALMFHTGSNILFNSSLVACNLFENKDFGAAALGDNRHLNLWENTFDLKAAGSRDFAVSGIVIPGLASIPGSVRLFQGHPQIPAGNCFTAPDIKPDIATFAPTERFNYFFKGGTHADCGHEPLTFGNYDKFAVMLPEGEFNCANYGGVPSPPVNPTETGLEQKRQRLAALAGHISAHPDSLALYYHILEEKDALLKHFLSAALDSADYQKAEQLLTGEQSRAGDWAIFGLRASRKDFAGALAWLQQLPQEDAADEEFREVQSINLAFHQDPAGYALSQAGHSYLENVASGAGPVRDYARSILGLIKGQRFSPSFDLGLEEASPPPGIISATLPGSGRWRLYPNPADDAIELEWPSRQAGALWEAVVYDLMGRVSARVEIDAASGRHAINVSLLRSGMYFISVFDEGGRQQYRSKFVVKR